MRVTTIRSRVEGDAQVGFSEPGELAVFTNEETITSLEKLMEETGYLDGATMANAFNMLRPDDLSWSYVVNNYLREGAGGLRSVWCVRESVCAFVLMLFLIPFLSPHYTQMSR